MITLCSYLRTGNQHTGLIQNIIISVSVVCSHTLYVGVWLLNESLYQLASLQRVAAQGG